MSITRKSFLSHTAAAAGALVFSKATIAAETKAAAPAAQPAKPAEAAKAAEPAPPPPSAIHFPVLKPNEFDQKKMLEALKVKKEHKVVFESVEPNMIVPGLSSLYIHIQNCINAGEISMGWGKGNVASAAVVLGPSVVLALNDAMWAKYKIGEALKINDATGKGETSNSTYKAQTPMGFDGDPGAGGNVYQDWSAEACMKRGTTFMVCHNALAAFAGRFAMGAKANPADVLTEWKANMLPGFMLVPAGVGALHVAMENGWKMIPVI